jgi:hypothetical protein
VPWVSDGYSDIFIWDAQTAQLCNGDFHLLTASEQRGY